MRLKLVTVGSVTLLAAKRLELADSAYHTYESLVPQVIFQHLLFVFCDLIRTQL